MPQKQLHKPQHHVRRENASVHAKYFDHLPDLCRHEDAGMVDVNRIVAQFGGDLRRFAVVGADGGVFDFDLDLQSAISMVDRLRDDWFKLDEQVRQAFPSWISVADAIRSGALEEVEGQLRIKRAAAAAGGSGAGAAGSPSDSAAGGGTGGA